MERKRRLSKKKLENLKLRNLGFVFLGNGKYKLENQLSLISKNGTLEIEANRDRSILWIFEVEHKEPLRFTEIFKYHKNIESVALMK